MAATARSPSRCPICKAFPSAPGRVRDLSDYTLGQAGGEMTVTLTPQQMPIHNHPFNAVNSQATSATPEGNQLARAWRALEHTDAVVNFYSNHSGNTPLAPNAIVASGSGQPHNNLQPFLAVNFCIATEGIMPSPEGAPAPVRQA